MSVNLSVKGVPDEWAVALRARAERNHRSLQGELMAIIAGAVAQDTLPQSTPARGPQASMSQGRKTIEDLLSERRARPLRQPAGLPLAVDILRADRDRR